MSTIKQYINDSSLFYICNKTNKQYRYTLGNIYVLYTNTVNTKLQYYREVYDVKFSDLKNKDLYTQIENGVKV